MNHDNPMMIRFVKDEMTLKITFLLCDLIVIVNVLGSCAIAFEKRCQPSIILTTACVAFSTNAKLRCRTNFLSLKHANVFESRSAWVHIVVDLPPLIVMGNKNQGVGFEDKVGPF
jgi:hypothetical protein